MPTVSPAVAGFLSMASALAVVIGTAVGAVPAGSNVATYGAAVALAVIGYFHLASPPTAGPLAK